MYGGEGVCDRMFHHDGVGHIENEVATHLQTTVRILYKDVLMSIETEILNITVLMAIMLALSVSTAVMERCVSAMNNIKNNMRTTKKPQYR